MRLVSPLETFFGHGAVLRGRFHGKSPPIPQDNLSGARQIAANIAKLLELLRKTQRVAFYQWVPRGSFFHTVRDNVSKLHNLLAQCRIFRNVALNAITSVL